MSATNPKPKNRGGEKNVVGGVVNKTINIRKRCAAMQSNYHNVKSWHARPSMVCCNKTVNTRRSSRLRDEQQRNHSFVVVVVRPTVLSTSAPFNVGLPGLLTVPACLLVTEADRLYRAPDFHD
jgi:hypothetical protein